MKIWNSSIEVIGKIDRMIEKERRSRYLDKQIDRNTEIVMN